MTEETKTQSGNQRPDRCPKEALGTLGEQLTKKIWIEVFGVMPPPKNPQELIASLIDSHPAVKQLVAINERLLNEVRHLVKLNEQRYNENISLNQRVEQLVEGREAWEDCEEGKKALALLDAATGSNQAKKD